MAILSGFVYFYKYTSTRIITPDSPTDYVWTPGKALNTMEEGFAWLKIDKNGYNNVHEKANGEQVDILLMGSSHMLGTEVPADANTGYLLNELLPYRTYNIGMTGHYLSTCINNLPFALDRFHPDKYVIIQTQMVSPTLKEMEEVLLGTYGEVESDSGRLIKLLQTYVPASKKLMIQVEAWRQTEKTSKEKIDSQTEEYQDVLRKYLSLAKGYTADYDTKLVILYTGPTKIDEAGNMIPVDEDVEGFSNACRDCGILFVDMTEDFKRQYESEHILTHGFINTAIGAGHLNKYGHALIAERLAQVIKEDEQ